MSSKKIRPAPAYQEYASDMLANANYRMMSLAERGLLETMRKECWVNHSIPANKSDLSLYLRCDIEEINESLTDRVMSFFIEQSGKLVCIELEAYRQNQIEREKKISEGGRRGGKTTQEKNKSNQGGLKGGLKPLSGDEMNGDEWSGEEKKLVSKDLNKEPNEWIKRFNNSPAIQDYLRASRG